jgi:predicted transcriptional regulator of viral defense system
MSTFDDAYGRQSCSRLIAELATRQHGVVSLEQPRALGLGARGVQHRATMGKLHRVHRGVYAVGHRLLSADGRRMAAVPRAATALC